VRKQSTRLVLCAFLLSSAAGAAPDDTASDLLDNTVSLRAEWQDGRQESGFGIIVGENDGMLVIATANHVVRGRMPGDVSDSVRVRFHSSGAQPVAGDLLPFADSARDIALLQAPIPAGLAWRTDILARHAEIERGDEVVYIGRAGDWYIPASFGRINEPRNLEEQIIADGLNVRVGSSGGPLVSDDGLVGMVVSREADGVARALHVDFIERFVRHNDQPWDLAASSSLGSERPARQSRIISRPEDGARAYSPSPETLLRGGSEPSYAFDGLPNTRFTALARPGNPYQLVLELPAGAPWIIDTIEFIQETGDPRSHLRDLALYVSIGNSDEWQLLKETYLTQTVTLQRVPLDWTTALSAIRFNLKSSWGRGPASIAQIQVRGRR